MAWGQQGGDTDWASCASLIDRVRRNEITDLIILPGKRFTGSDLVQLADAFRNNNDVTNNICRSIQASGHAVTCEALKALGTVLVQGNCSLLEHLAIGDSSMGDVGVQALVDGILRAAAGDPQPEAPTTTNSSNNNKIHIVALSLRRLDLSYKGLSWKSLICLDQLTAHFPNLEWLDLSRNTFRDEDVVEDVPPLHPPSATTTASSASILATVTDLNLSDCGWGRAGLQRVLGDAEVRAPRCRILRLADNPQLKCAGVFSMVFSSSSSSSSSSSLPCLEHLVASNCGISDFTDDLSSGSFVLNTTNNRLRILDVSNNRLNVEFIKVIAQCLPQLVELNVAGNPTLGTSGARTLAQLLATMMTSLHTLDVSACQLGMDGALELIQAVEQQGSSLKSLRLFDSQLGSVGFYALAESFQKHDKRQSDKDPDARRRCCFTTLDLAGNGADAASVAALIAAAAPWVVDCLVVGGNEGGPIVEEAIRVAQVSYPRLDVARDVVKRQQQQQPQR